MFKTVKDVELEDFRHNIQRKVTSDSYSLDKYRRFKLLDETRAAKFEKLRKELKNRSQNSLESDPAVVHFCIDLAFQKLQELDVQPQKELNQLAEVKKNY